MQLRPPIVRAMPASLSCKAGRLSCVLLALALLIDVIAAPPGYASSTPPAFSTLATARQPAPGYTPQQLETAYHIAPLLTQGIDGSGETIALIELDRFDPSDIQQFDAANQLLDPTIDQFYPGGQSFPLPRRGETTMDLEWAHALAPGAKIQIYYLRSQQANAAGWRAMAAAVNAAVANGASAISLSFGTCKPTNGYTVARQAFARALGHGVTVLVSSGDSGAYPGPMRECGPQPGVGYPASDPSVVSVGGTSLLLNLDSTIDRQVAWHLSGGGKGKPLPRPSWQVMPTLGPGRYRYAPDVAFLADPATGAAIFYNGDWRRAGGTSLGAPAWAAIWALVQQDGKHAGKTVGAASPLVYRIGNSPAYSQAFNDITVGSNGQYRAGPGWDPVTGWGTPNVAELATAIQAISTA